MNRAYYSAAIAEFRTASPDAILGAMARHNEFDLVENQRNAWVEQTAILQRTLQSHQGSIYLEFIVPRMGKRIDAVLIIGPVLFVVEFKVEKKEFEFLDLDQVVDYALDLHNFHEGSHNVYIAPIEDVATEFHVQGLELDWTCVVWDADFRFEGNAWAHWSFRGSRWERVKVPERQNYLKNAYRVLLRRARQGMVIVVPPGDASDHTRPPAFYDSTFEYLQRIGLNAL